MERIHGFEPIVAPGAHTLILGSMPSVKSLDDARYYAHPRNAFWPIMRRLLDIREHDYARVTRAVARHGFAVWDVVASCRRPGSLDSDIEPTSIVVNDIPGLLAEQPGITRIFFNGTAAESLFRRHVVPELGDAAGGLRFERLPSTSPAHAARNFEQKLDAWRAILPDRDGGGLAIRTG